MDYNLPGSSVHGTFQARILEWVAVPSSRALPDPGIKPASPALQADSLLLSNGGSPSNHYIYSKKKLQKWYIHALQILYIGLLSKH